MAKKKDNPDNITVENYVERLRDEINKEFGTNICKTADDIRNIKKEIIQWTPALNLILGGGIPTGSWISVCGKPKTGKTTYLLHLGAKAQKLGRCLWFLDAEGRFKNMNLDGVKELDQSPDKFRVIQSTKDKILSQQDFLRTAEKIIKTYPGSFIIIDSISALADEKELEGGFETETRGHSQRVLSKFINNIGQLVSATDSIVAGVVHIISNTSGFGAKNIEKSAIRWVYQADVRLKIQFFDIWKAGGEAGNAIGQILHWKCDCSALGKPFGLCDSYLRYGYGPDELYEIFEFANACGLISKAGAWYTMSFLENNKDLWAEEELPKFQGGEKVWSFLQENPKITAYLNKKVMEFSDNLIKSGDAE